ncbi:MAG: hypothetical protein Q8P51_18995 [Ignavibacteria bacterium]|nr:hypothetical protein [Ignavibacteria bacterium]
MAVRPDGIRRFGPSCNNVPARYPDAQQKASFFKDQAWLKDAFIWYSSGIDGRRELDNVPGKR